MTRTLFQQAARLGATLQDIDTYVAQGVARALYVHAFRMWAIDVDPAPEFPADSDWEKVAPDTVMNRAAGIQAARELEDGIAQKNPRLGRFPYAAVFKKITSVPDADFDTRIRGVHPDAAGRSFGALLASVCLGTDEPGPLAQFALPTVHVELDDDGREMSWDMSWEDIPESMVNPSRNSGGRWAHSDVQSLLFDKERYTARQAQRWAQDHGFKYGSVDEGHGEYIHVRQFEPAPGRPCATVDFGHQGIRARVCSTRNPAQPSTSLRDFATEVNAELPYIQSEPSTRGAKGRFGDRKVFIAALWRQLRTSPAFEGMTLDRFKQRLVEAHEKGLLVLARADLVAAMDPDEVAQSQWEGPGGFPSYHFVVEQSHGLSVTLQGVRDDQSI
jgi:hypothetical protein